MPNHASAKKALRVSHRREVINTRATDAFKDVKKEIKKQLLSGSVKEAKADLSKAYSKVDAAVKKAAIHVNTGARIKSRLASMVKKAEKTSAKTK